MTFRLTINGKPRTVDVDPDMPLLWVLRDELNIKGPKFGCGAGLCGACTVHLDGQPVRSCQVPVASIGAAKVTTIEALDQTALGRAVQKTWLELDVMQCGYCQAGQMMSATALLASNPRPTDAEIDAAMGGNLCRCATYNRIRAAIHQVAALAAKA